MEKRAILAAVLMAAVFIVYQMFFFPEPPPQKPPEKPAAQTTSQPAPAPTAIPVAPAAAAAAPAPASQAPRPPQRLVTVESPLYRAVVSSEGGKLQELELRYRGNKPMVILGELGPRGLHVAPDASSPGEVVPMTIDRDQLVLTDKPGDLVLTGEAHGLKIRLTLRFHPDGYAIDAFVHLENRGTAPSTAVVSLPWYTRQTWRATPEKFQGQHPTEIVLFSHGTANRIDDLTAAHSIV